jgi:hypothetical protein
MLFTADAAGQAKDPTPTFHAARLITGAWLQPQGLHRLYAARVDTNGPRGLVKAFAVRRPDGQLGVLIVNRDPVRSYALTAPGLNGRPADLWTYSAAQYAWVEAGPQSRVDRSDPPIQAHAPRLSRIDVPPASLTVLLASPRPGSAAAPAPRALRPRPRPRAP